MNAETSPQPCDYTSLSEWLDAVLQAHAVSAATVSRAIGRSINTVAQIVRSGRATRPTIDRLAEYFDVNRGELRALRPKSEAHIAAGKATAARLGETRMLELAEMARASYTPERRAEVNARDSDRRAGVMRRNWRQLRDPFMQNAAATAASRRSGEERPCEWCGQGEPIHRERNEIARGRRWFHLRCYREYRRSPELKDYSKSLGTVGWIWGRVKISGDQQLKQTIHARMAGTFAQLRKPSRQGRPATLLRDRYLAVHIAELHDDGAIPVRQIATLAGFKLSLDPRGHDSQARHVYGLLRLGRALRGRSS